MEQVSISQAAKQDQRIIYVEPNDVFDKDVKNESGKSLTPKYEDFCISFNLIVETFRRFKNEIKHIDSKDKNESNKYSIQWNLTREEQLKQRTSILQGNRGKDGYINADGTLSDTGYDYNYLTTYYTDLSFDSYKKTEIEGLGVESVQISYESWYTPTIVIKFVDVRGSALWGREEAIHTDEKITAENVFGAFFTMPYPLFRLQVKGFLGRPVTYQLACSNFKGEFNAQTGNFEAVVTFIGYSWSLLTDIPFTYLIAAPYAPGKGFKYWNENVNKEEWRLWDGESSYLPPPKLYDFFTSIKKAISAEVVGATAEQKEQLTLISGEKKELNDIAKSIKNFIQKVENDVSNNVIQSLSPGNDENAQILLFHDSDSVSFGNDTKTAYQEMIKSLSEYINSDKYQNLPITKPNGWENDEQLPTISFLEKFIVNKGTNGNIMNISVKEITSDVTVDKLQKLDFNDKNGKLNTEIATKIVEAVNNKNSKIIKNYCYLIDFGKTLQSAEKRINDNNHQENSIRKQIEQQLNTNIVELLGGRGNGFKPFIGNVFKVIFCHLETFCHMVLDCANDIYAQMKVNERTAKVLGLQTENKKDFTQTDLYENDAKNNITPFPAIHNEGEKGKDGCGYINPNCNNIYGWVGDISSHKFLEEQLVYSLQEGIQFVTEQQELQQKTEKIVDFPILPSDFNDNVNVFGNAPVQTVSDIAGNLAIRLTNILGILCNPNFSNQSLIQTLGRLDAYNLYTKISSVTLFKSLFNDTIKPNLLENIMYCDTSSEEANNYATENDGDNKKIYSFETAKRIKQEYNNQGRHPFFLREEKKNSSKWIHFYDEHKNGITPAVLSNFEFYHGGVGEKFFNFDTKEYYFTPIITNNTIKCLHLCSSKTFINDNVENYTNRYMFDILTEDSEINSVKNRFSELSNGGLKIGEYNVNDDLKPYLKQFIKLDVENKVGFFQNVYKMLSGNASKIGLYTEGLLSEGMKIISYNWWKKSNTVKVKNDGNFEITIGDNPSMDIALSELVIQEFKVKWKDDNIDYNLFGCPFYYEQKDDYVKALLFLHTFKYNYDKIINVFSSNKTNGATEEVPKAYLLLLGGLLWWKNGGYDKYNVFNDTKKPSNNETFFVKKNEGRFFKLLNDGSKSKYIEIKEFFGGLNDIDINIKNQLINTFKNFAEKDFKAIKETYELKKNYNKTAQDFSGGKDFQTTVNNLYNAIKKIIEGKNPKLGSEIIINDDGITGKLIYNAINSTFVMASGSYSCISLNLKNDGKIDSTCLIMLLDESNTEMQNSIKDLYFNTYIVTDNCYLRLNKNAETNKEIVINNSSISNYLKGFTDACKDILTSETETVGGVVDESVSKDVYKNRDVSIAIYYYLKNLWDKWLCTASYEQYDVKYFFNENFIFTDSFYINTYNKLAINCETILKTYNELAMEGTLFHFLGNICKDHGCIFLPVPDYVGFNGKTQKEDIATMDDLFRPLPYSGLGKVENSNKFIIMYTHSPSSSVESKESDFPSDSYDIWSHGNATEVGKALFKAATDKGDENKPLATREGYNVPSFGISFAKQNNHIFKNFKVSMDNPVMTEQAIKAISNIMNKANSDGLRKVAFIGQDIFNVFTNYSYTITVDMIGNAQICPLMYFQLTNIPMWRGTYMIFKVTHNMIPGDMTTTITAMKMNKYALPFNTAFFTPVRNTTSNRDCESNSGSSGGSSSTVTSGDVVGIVGDSYVVGLSGANFVDKAKQNGITAKIKVEQGQGNVKENGYCKVGAHVTDTKGITNAINDGCTAIVIHLGINSAGSGVDNIQKNLANGVKLAQGRGVKVFLCIPTKWRNALDENYKNLVTAITGAINDTQCGKIDYRKLQNSLNFADGIHPSGNGYSLITEEIIKQLKAEGIKEYSTTTTYTGKVNITNSNMKKIFEGGFDKYYHSKNGWRPVNRQSRSECTAGPSTWYERAGNNNHGRKFITRNWWQKSDTPSASSATYSQTKEIFEGLGFELVWHGTSDAAYKLDKSILRPGDLSTLFCRYTSGKKNGLSTAHGAMWTGSEWRSDFIQNNLWVYGSGKGREGEYSVCIWRHPDLQ